MAGAFGIAVVKTMEANVMNATSTARMCSVFMVMNLNNMSNSID